LLHGSEYESLIVEQTENWEADRIAVMELIILKTAVAEFVNFPSIPLKVTLNEYIEISKRFCSEKSRIFVNGLLHKLSAELQSRHMIKKTGRGLI
ncbi:MAG: antitermination protein NusB, partial [Bacteroidales bacterium]|nr:antitermination protein NusB [Bacteroidales bacterium]